MEQRILKRSEKAIESFEKYGIEMLLLTKKADIRYLTDIPGDDCAVLLTRDKRILITDSRYEVAVSVVKPDFDVVIKYDLMEFLKDFPIKKMGVQDQDISLSFYKELLNYTSEAEIIPATGLMEDLRMVKDDVELGYIEEAEMIGDKAFREILNYIKPGVTEKQIATHIEYTMKKNGAEGFSFDTICVSGINSSKPHGIPSDKPLEKGDFLTMDFGCIYKGYCSDMTRTVAVDHATDEMRQVYDVVLKAQLAACNGLKAGIHVKDGDALARDIINAAGYGQYFGHGLGHSVGLEIHEDPFLSFRGRHVLEKGMTVTIEPGIYLPGKFGVRIEDLAVITEKGIVNLTESPKELIVL